MTWRCAAVAQSGKPPTFGEPVLMPKKRPPIVYVFSGQGTQYFHSEFRIAIFLRLLGQLTSL